MHHPPSARAFSIALVMLAAGCAALPAPAAQPAPRIEGQWIFHFVKFGEEYAPARVSIEVDDGIVSGTLNELSIDGKARRDSLSFRAARPNGSVFGSFEGRLSGGELRGTMSDGPNQVDWVMRPLPPARPPATHDFRPTTFSRTFSALRAPVLTVNPGDTIRTSTLDSAGFDQTGVRRSFGGNPQTGPFFVNGALPGDTLVVRLKRLALNRDTGRSGTRLVSVTVSHDHHRDTQYTHDTGGEWLLDRATMTARLARPSAGLRDYRVALTPFLGGIGVAPDIGQAIDARALGNFGGNLDYNGLTEGTTVYLPVLEEGALLYVGDGHAAQGAGEVTGDAIETSLDVELGVELLPGRAIGFPRAENDRYLMAMGIAGSAQDAIRQATTELARWLGADYGFSPEEVALVLGTAVHYDIAELVSPQINAVARLEKSMLPARREAR
jgi:acetamidase/formamidase